MDDMDAVDGSYTAVLDRIEAGAEADEELAVLVIERDGRAVGDLVVALDALPADGRAVDTVLDIVVDDGDLVSAAVDTERTASRQDRSQRRFRRLSRRLPRRGEDATDEEESKTDEDAESKADQHGNRATEEADSSHTADDGKPD